MKKILAASAVLASLSIGAFARGDVENQAVADRMAAMTAIGGSMKTLGGMAKGATDFDAAIAQAAIDTIEAQAAAVPVLFEAQETDPMSESKPEIWSNWDDFVSKANSLNAAAAGITITDAASVGPALGAVGGSCKDCHSKYRM
jgi:cytochrome c556